MIDLFAWQQLVMYQGSRPILWHDCVAGSALQLVVFCMAMGSSHVAEVSVAVKTYIYLCVFDMSICECRG